MKTTENEDDPVEKHNLLAKFEHPRKRRRLRRWITRSMMLLVPCCLKTLAYFDVNNNNVGMKCFIWFKKQKLNHLDKLVLNRYWQEDNKGNFEQIEMVYCRCDALSQDTQKLVKKEEKAKDGKKKQCWYFGTEFLVLNAL